MFKGSTASGMKLPSSHEIPGSGVLISVEDSDYQEVMALAKRFYDLGLKLYATTGTAQADRLPGPERHRPAQRHREQ